MTYRSCRAQRVPFTVSLWDAVVPEGSFYWSRMQQGDWEGDCIWIKIPYDPTHLGHPWHCMAVYRKCDPIPPHGWLWDGNLYEPTLNPSIACGPEDERLWHGYLTAGVLKGDT